jgi:hypothetical protein
MPLRPRLEQLATVTGTLSPRQVRLLGGTLAELDRLDRRQAAILAARDALDPDRRLSTWQCAKALERALRRFDGTPRKRILAGHRPPSRLEIALLVLVTDGPQCARKLWTEIRELP